MSDPKVSDIEEIAQTDGRSAWLMTYADLITLILVFFVLLFAISNESMKKLTETLKSFEITIGTETPNTRLFDIIDTSSLERERKLDQLIGLREADILREINSFIGRKNLENNIEARFAEGKIILSVEGNVLFNSGSVDLLEGAYYILEEIVQIIRNNPTYDVDIQGHTDDRPISTEKFASNWELSAIRATTVLRYLIEKGISEEILTATGFADLRPVAGNDTQKGRSKNRRVEFVLKKKE
jgi:chemotaxis protein MotB